MNPKLKKMWPAAAASLVCLTSLAQAANGNGNGTMQQSDARAQGSTMRNNQGAPRNDVINPAARPTVKDGVDLFVSGDFLWWNASVDDMQYTVCVDEGRLACCDTDNAILRTYRGEVREPDYDWGPGFRIGLGYNMPRDGWDIFFQWTRLYVDNTDKCCAFPCDTLVSSTCGCPSMASGAGFDACCGQCSTCKVDPCCCATSGCNAPTQFSKGCCGGKSNPCNDCPQCCPSQDCDCCCEPCCPCVEVCFDCCCPTNLIPVLCPYSTPDNYATTFVAFEKWRLRFNMLDGEIGREFFVSKHLTLRPFFGVRGVWASERYNTNYESPVSIVDQGFNGTGVSVGNFEGCQICCSEFNHCFEGVGLRFGFNTDWLLAGGLSIYADAAISGIWGKYDLKAESDLSLCGNLTQLQTFDFQNPVFVTSSVNDCAKYILNDDFHSGKAMTDLALGLKWAGTFANDRVGLMIKIGYDNHILINYNQLIQFKDQNDPSPLFPVGPANPGITSSWNRQLTLDARRHGDLVLHGLVVSAQLDF